MRYVPFVLFISGICAFGEVTYQLTEGASACGEVRIPKWTRPVKADDPFQAASYACGYDVRKLGSTLLIGLSCGYSRYWRMTEKYAVDLAHPEAVHQVDENTWETATGLDRGTKGGWDAFLNEAQHPSHFPKSGPKLGGGTASPGGSREAVYSWSGTVRDGPELISYEGSFLDFFLPWKQAHYEGHYWTDIYDTASTRRLVQIRGDFHGESPQYFQGEARWLDGRYYFMPLEPNMTRRQPLERDGMRRLLICDIDGAAKAGGVAESDAPVPLEKAKPYLEHSRSYYQLRFLEAETPQAHITAFDDEPVFSAATGFIERINVTASVDVQVPGRYSLELNLSGSIQERADADLGVGGARLSVPIPADRLRELGSGGPYRIYSARLIRQVVDGQIVAENRFDPELATGLQLGAVDLLDARTQPYTLSALGSELYFTGQNSAALMRGGGLEPDRLQVRIGIYSQDTDCRGYGGLARAELVPDAMVKGPPGAKTLVLNFTGKGVSEPGPYQIVQMGVRCGRNFIRSGRIDIPADSMPLR